MSTKWIQKSSNRDSQPASLLELIQLLLGGLCCLLPFACFPAPVPEWSQIAQELDLRISGWDATKLRCTISYLASSASLEKDGVSSAEAIATPPEPNSWQNQEDLGKHRVAPPVDCPKPASGWFLEISPLSWVQFLASLWNRNEGWMLGGFLSHLNKTRAVMWLSHKLQRMLQRHCSTYF